MTSTSAAQGLTTVATTTVAATVATVACRRDLALSKKHKDRQTKAIVTVGR
jgi:hypothetical protein